MRRQNGRVMHAAGHLFDQDVEAARAGHWNEIRSSVLDPHCCVLRRLKLRIYAELAALVLTPDKDLCVLDVWSNGLTRLRCLFVAVLEPAVINSRSLVRIIRQICLVAFEAALGLGGLLHG